MFSGSLIGFILHIKCWLASASQGVRNCQGSFAACEAFQNLLRAWSFAQATRGYWRAIRATRGNLGGIRRLSGGNLRATEGYDRRVRGY